MADDAKLQDLLSRWQKERDQGRDLPADALCTDHPGLADELQRRIDAVRQLDHFAPQAAGETTTPAIAEECAMIEFPCSGCGATLLAKEEWVGKEIKCPDCGGRMLVAMLASETETVPPRLAAGESEAVTLPPTASAPTISGQASVAGYEILGELGRGGMGVVYKARHVKLGRLVALKMILVAEHAGPEERARFQTEAEAVARLQHPNIVQIYEVGEQDGRPFFSLEFCAGGSLEKKLGGVPLPPKEAARLAETLARAMHAAHEAGVVHRDLKPANVLLAKDGTPKITDFGLAKKLDEVAQTASGAIMGTPSYMAPEQAGGQSKKIGPHTDVYALGAILYELLTGRPPFRAATALDTILQVVSDEPVPPTQLQPKTPRDLETICLKCLQKEPAKRYASAAAMAEDLRRFQIGEPIQARPVGRVERAWRWCRRNPAVAGLAAAVAAVLLLGTAAATGFAVRALGEKRQKEQELTRAEWLLYANQLSLAQSAWNENQADLAWEYLDQTRPDYRGWEYHYLSTLFFKNHRVLRGPATEKPGPGTVVAFSPDSNRVVHGRWVWDVATGQEVLTLDEKSCAIAFSPDGQRLVGLGKDNTVQVWDAATGKELLTLRGHTRPVSTVAFSPDGRRLASASEDGSVKLWDAATGKEEHPLKRGGGSVQCVAFSPDGKRLASASEGGSVKLWDAATGKELCDFSGHRFAVHTVAFSPDGKRVVSASQDGTVRVWDPDTAQEVLALKGLVRFGEAGYVPQYAACFSPDGKRLAGLSEQGLRLWDADTGEEVLKVYGVRGGGRTLAFSPDGRHLASAGGGTVRVWDAKRGQKARVLAGGGHMRALCFSPDGRRLGGTSNPEVRLWDVDRGQEVLAIKGHAFGAGALAFCADGQRLACAFADQPTVTVLDAATGQEVLALQGRLLNVTAVACSPDGQRLASASQDAVQVWDSATGREALAMERPGQSTAAVAFSPDGKRLAGACWDGTVRVWDAATGREALALAGHAGPDAFNGRVPVTGVCYSPDGKRLASAGTDKTVRVWDAVTGRQVFSLERHGGAVRGVCYSPDGRRLVSASDDGTIRVWEADKGQEVLILRGHALGVGTVAFSPDGKRLASACWRDRTVHLWDADN
jgi:WD40 repeat protein/tRNA A-37 threonylcarbamoyl transferase component Bud32/DNA-directed RNA polymerase subunit RPC12/RpoP